MHVDRYERIWMWAAGALIVAFVAVVVATSVAHAVHPPSHVETIDPATARKDPRFAAPGVSVGAGGTQVVMLAQMFSFTPAEVHVKAGVPVTFRITSPDVIHGFEIVGTNVNTMVIPGYVSQLTVSFPRPGEYLLVCHEFCGLNHHLMQGKVLVEAP
jgi:cytochrome c oxidase subunit 2